MKVTWGNVASYTDTCITVRVIYVTEINFVWVHCHGCIYLVLFFKHCVEPLGSKSSGFICRLCCIKITVYWYLGTWKGQGEFFLHTN